MASLCDTMRRQILSRAFYGWLAYCRHLKTVRLHLTSLVYPMSNDFGETIDDPSPLTAELWTQLLEENNSKEIFRRIYSAGCEPSLRRRVWPFLFAHYAFDSTDDERTRLDESHRRRYATLVERWRNAEEIIAQRATRRTNVSLNAPDPLQRKDSNVSNDVFYEVLSFVRLWTSFRRCSFRIVRLRR